MVEPHSIIKEVREGHHLKQKEFARILGVSQGSVALWEKKGIRTPKDADLLICEKFGLELWELYAPPEIRAATKGTSRYYAEEVNMIMKYRMLSKERKKLIDDMLDNLIPQ